MVFSGRSGEALMLGVSGWISQSCSISEPNPQVRSLPPMRNPPDRAVAVFGHQQRAVMCDGHADRPSPDLGVVDDKAGCEILVFPGGYSILQTNTDDFVARALGSVP